MAQHESLTARYGTLVAGLQDALAVGDEAGFRDAFERLRGEVNVELNPELKRITASVQGAITSTTTP